LFGLLTPQRDRSMPSYRIRNWPEYSRALKNRGNLTLWVSDDALAKWLNSTHTCQRGRPRNYSDDAILCTLMVREIFHLPRLALEGFLVSLLAMLKLCLPVPFYSQISRRSSALDRILQRLSSRRPSVLVSDSFGLKVYGEGEWKVRQHGADKRRTWRKFHIALDPDSQEIILSELTPASAADEEVGETLLKQAGKRLKKVFGDGAYDSHRFRKAAHDRGADVIVLLPAQLGIIPTPETLPPKRAIEIWRRSGGSSLMVEKPGRSSEATIEGLSSKLPSSVSNDSFQGP
jgi:hypothetical protein